jgi:hypothetical protein
MDFMVSLPPSKGFDEIMVVVDPFNNMTHLIPTKENATTQERGRLFFMHVFKHHGLPKDIVLNRDPKFRSKFLTNLVEVHGAEVQDEHLISTPNIWTNRENEIAQPNNIVYYTKHCCDEVLIVSGKSRF